jgi:hypothetical protein
VAEWLKAAVLKTDTGSVPPYPAESRPTPLCDGSQRLWSATCYAVGAAASRHDLASHDSVGLHRGQHGSPSDLASISLMIAAAGGAERTPKRLVRCQEANPPRTPHGHRRVELTLVGACY